MLNLMDKSMWLYVVKDILVELRYAPFAILLGVMVYFIIRIVLPSKDKGKRNFTKAVLLIYLFALIHITLLEREPGTRNEISLTLFETIGGSRGNAYVIENVLLFIPFGFLSAILVRPMRNAFFSLVAGGICSLAIETVQLITQRGHFQVDDIWTNSMGMALGCICCWFFGILARMIGYGHGKR